jgi:hypothetical protein
VFIFDKKLTSSILSPVNSKYPIVALDPWSDASASGFKLQPRAIHNYIHHYVVQLQKFASPTGQPQLKKSIQKSSLDFKAQSPHPISQGMNKHPATYDISIYQQTPSTTLIFSE